MNFPSYRALRKGALVPHDLIPEQARLGMMLDLSQRNFALIDASGAYSMMDVGGDWLAGIADVVKGWDAVATNPPFDACWLEAEDAAERTNVSVAVYRDDSGTGPGWNMLVFCHTWGFPFISSSPGLYRFEWDENGILRPNVEVRCWSGSAEAMESARLQQTFTTLALIAFAFCHCKNVDLVERLPKRHEQREAKRRGEPILKYHEIVIDPNRSYTTAETSRNVSTAPSKSLHLVRGHFAHYTEDKPLFGKYVGTFWVPAHVRGSAEVGTVKSTYRVKAGTT